MIKCSVNGKCSGSVKRRPILRFNGVVWTDVTTPKCDRHYKIDLRNAVKRGQVAAAILAGGK